MRWLHTLKRSHLSQGNIFSVLKFNNVLFTVNYLKATVCMKLPYVTRVEPTHSSLVNLNTAKKPIAIKKNTSHSCNTNTHQSIQCRAIRTLYTSFDFSSFLKYPTVTFGPPITISPRGIGESLVRYPPSAQSINYR